MRNSPFLLGGADINTGPACYPLVAHLSHLSYRSLLSSLANAATQTQFQSIYNTVSDSTQEKSLIHQQLLIAVRHWRPYEFVRSVDRWCAKREEDLFHSQRGHGRQLAVSLLGFDGSLRLRMAGVLEVVDVVLHWWPMYKIMRCLCVRRRIRHSFECSWRSPTLLFLSSAPSASTSAGLGNAR